MTIRERIEADERRILGEDACLAVSSRGRVREEAPCPMRTCFQRDRDRIIHSKAFRRLKHKTQVFMSPEGDHYRTRLTHTLEVAQIARTIARALCLNEDLTEAAALGHDLGHTPFGHAGERALDEVCPMGFSHNEQSLRVVDCVEKDGEGLNLTHEVRDGIVCHTGRKHADTKEGRVIHFADRIAYINHDIDDAIRAGILKNEEIPEEIRRTLGQTHKLRIDTLVRGVIDYAARTGEIGLDEELARAMLSLRTFMFERVYTNRVAKSEEVKGIEILRILYSHFTKNTSLMPEEYKRIAARDGVERAACDYIAGMTDRYAIALFSDLYIPHVWSKL